MNVELPLPFQDITVEKVVEVLTEMAKQTRYQAEEEQLRFQHFHPLYVAELEASHDTTLSDETRATAYDRALRIYDAGILAGRNVDRLTAEARVLETAVTLLSPQLVRQPYSEEVLEKARSLKGHLNGRIKAVKYLRDVPNGPKLSLKEAVDIVDRL